MLPFFAPSITEYPSNIFFENELKEIELSSHVQIPFRRQSAQHDISETLPEINSKQSARKPYNYRLGYRTAIGCRSHTNKLLYGSTLYKTLIEKKVEISDEEFLQDVAGTQKITQTNIFENIDWQVPDQLRKISNLPYIVSVIKKVDKKTEHKMSSRSRAKLKDKIFALYRSNLKNHFFVTLTFINKVSDEESVKILNKFFTVLRQDYGKFNYIWVAERQKGERNNFEHCTNNVHFHIMLDKRFDIQTINSLWVLQQYNAGIEYPSYCRETIEFFHQYDSIGVLLNPVDVKKIIGINGLSSYLTKYVTKNEDSFSCRVWHCSRNISRLFTSVHISRSTFSSVACAKKNVFKSEKTGKIYTFKTIVTEHAIIHTIVNKRAYLYHMGFLEHLNERILKGHQEIDVSALIMCPNEVIKMSIN